MRSILLAVAVGTFVLGTAACGGDGGDKPDNRPQCMNGKDDDGDGMVDYPDDLGCTSADDTTEDSAALPKCSDGRDNDMDGKTDYPADPGCFAPQQDSEDDDCPDGPLCPQCSNGKDDDANGQTDYPDDTGCTAASDSDEYTENPVACGPSATIKKLPFDNHATATFMPGAPSNLTGMCGGTGPEDIYELRLSAPKVVVASTDTTLTSADTVLYIRGKDCAMSSSELACNNDVSSTNKGSSITVALQPGTYYLVVDAASSSTTGSYDLTVHFYVGEGVDCTSQDDCGPGLVCRIPLGGSTKVCSKHVCQDGVDDDGDGKNDFPDDPGCDKPTDDDEMDDCPNGPNCPECGNGIDDDGDTKTDYPMDTTCTSASNVSEACVASEGVTALTMPMTMDTTVGAVNDVKVACTSSSHTAGDKTYRLDVPALQSLSIVNQNTFDAAVALYNSTCTGTALQCGDEPENITLNNLAAGTYYYVVDGWSSGTGAYTIVVSGKIANGASCESALAQSGALTCGTGYACKGMMGTRTCQPAMCSDSMDNDSDGKADFPFDPGCDSPADDDEMDTCPGAGCPVCGNAMDDDMDTLTDFPADFGCSSAADTNETFCMTANKTETDLPITQVTTRNTSSTTTGKANDFLPSCQTFSSAPDVTFALTLPVPVQTLVMDTNNSFDTVLTFKDSHCAAEIACDDDSGDPSLESKITQSNVPAGSYAITVDGYNTNAGPFTLHVLGTVAAGTACSSPLFSGGANAVLQCPMNTTCTGTPLKCQ